MGNRNFKYKPSGVDQFITGIILLACIGFGTLIYFDMKNNTDEIPPSASGDVRELLENKRALQNEINRIKYEDN